MLSPTAAGMRGSCSVTPSCGGAPASRFANGFGGGVSGVIGRRCVVSAVASTGGGVPGGVGRK
ncbi:hypothetical protein [Kutzneria kofuensis]|uniref:hypothetical protein n=1 Tax=Kutzneria kofuensis TaxID=103725 RepID=UPI0031ED28FD